jgi:hypothetical protein
MQQGVSDCSGNALPLGGKGVGHKIGGSYQYYSGHGLQHTGD